MPHSPFDIRILVDSDADAWWKLRLEALEQEPDAFSASLDEHHAMGSEGVAHRLRFDPAERFMAGAFSGGALIGMAGFYREQGQKRRHEGHIWGVYVTPAARCRGVARQILRYLIDRAAAIDGVEQIVLGVTTTQTAAVRLYRSLGFQPFGCQPHALKIGGRYVDEEYLLLNLHPPLSD